MFEWFNEYRKKLPCPGSFESLHKEVKGTLPALHLVDGAKLDATAVLSQNFHVTHSLQWAGSQYPPTYHFGVGYQFPNSMLSGQLDSQYNLQARAHHVWSIENVESPANDLLVNPTPHSTLPKPCIKTKVDASLPAVDGHPPMIALEHEHIGGDYSISLKAINPNPIDGANKKTTLTGMYSASYLQSISETFSLGGEFLYQRPTPDSAESSYNLVARYIPTPSKLEAPSTLPAGMQSPFPPLNPSDPTQIFTASFSPSSGMLHTSYWKKLNSRLEVAAELQTLSTTGIRGGYGRREGMAGIGFKLQTIFAAVRGGIDTTGKVSGVSEYTLAPGLVFNISGEIDYGKSGEGAGKIGLGFALEA